MIDLYISQDIYARHEGKKDYIGKLIACRSVSVFLDVEDKELDRYLDISDEDLSKRSVSMDRGRNSIRSGKTLLDIMKEKKDVRYGLTKAIFIINSIRLSKVEKEIILDKYGVLCIDENDDELLELLCTEEGKRQRTTSKGENAFFYGDWDFYFKNFQSIPCTSLFFDDHYIKNDAWNFANFKRIISAFMSCGKISKPFQLLIICGDENGRSRNTFHQDYVPKFNSVLSFVAKSSGRQINVEYIYCKNDYYSKLYVMTHDRHIFSNYVTLLYLHTIKAFNYKVSKLSEKEVEALETQEIYTKTMFSEYISSKDNQTPEETSEIYLRDVKNVFDNVESWHKNKTATNTYQYFIIRGEKVEDQLPEIPTLKNNLIMENIGIKDGAKCYYLTVENDNNWANIGYIVDTFIYANYKECVAVNKGHIKTLNNYINQIKDLFNNHKYTPATAEDGEFYRIVVDYPSMIKTVHVKRSSDKEHLKAQIRDYPRNVFKYRNDAINMANQIAKICGFKRTRPDE